MPPITYKNQQIEKSKQKKTPYFQIRDSLYYPSHKIANLTPITGYNFAFRFFIFLLHIAQPININSRIIIILGFPAGRFSAFIGHFFSSVWTVIFRFDFSKKINNIKKMFEEYLKIKKHAWRDLDPQPTDSKSAALSS